MKKQGFNIFFGIVCLSFTKANALGSTHQELPYCKDVDTGPDFPYLFPTPPCIPRTTTPITPTSTSATSITTTAPATKTSAAKMSKTPTSPIKPPFSPELKLRCSLPDSGSEVVFIESITISKKTGIVALIALQTPARLESPAPNTAVGGNMTGGFEPLTHGNMTGISRSYLEMAITYPTREQAGEYQCEVNTIGTDGGFVQFTSSVVVEVTAVTLEDLTHVISRQREEIATLKKAKLIRVESGTISCGGRQQLAEGHFRSAFQAPPTVQVSVTLVNGTVSDMFYSVTTFNVTSTDFRLMCDHGGEMHVGWAASGY